jgi:acetyl-CoA carboxylase biotin carboxylase subunit
MIARPCMTLRRILIANRGEIALRVIRTCERLGIETVLAVSEADRDSVAARRADRIVCIGAAPSHASYLNVAAVVGAAQATGADAIHPGYGFLSENAALARACDAAGIVFIGATALQLAAVGDKLRARQHAADAGLPLVPGGAVASREEARALVSSIGCPVLIKAVAGGGGRGMQRVDDPVGLEFAVDRSIAEAQAAFGDPRVYLERYVAAGRHIEVQVLGDGERVIHLGTRDCSIQRRYQKLLEEAPAPHLTGAMRSAIESAAVAFASHLAYRGLGTVEMLLDCERDCFYFLEMNARIQVEHPVTEAICGLDLVAEQIAVAEGRALGLTQDEVRFEGHAIECRINAEDWRHDFQPRPGHVDVARFAAGAGIRIDTQVESGVDIPPFYDSLMAKIIVHGADRLAALRRLQAALAASTLEGVPNTLGLHRAIAEDAGFAAGGMDTGFLERFLAAPPPAGAAAAAPGRQP